MQHYYRRHVVRCADTGLGEVDIWLEDSRQTEVTNLDTAPCIEEDVCGFEVAVQYNITITWPAVTLLQCRRHLVTDLPDEILRNLWPATTMSVFFSIFNAATASSVRTFPILLNQPVFFTDYSGLGLLTEKCWKLQKQLLLHCGGHGWSLPLDAETPWLAAWWSRQANNVLTKRQ